MKDPKIHGDSLHRMITAAALFYDGKSQREIAEQLGINPSSISRLIAKARQFVEIRFNLPPDEALSHALVLKFGLTDAIVVDGGPESHTREVVAQAGVRFFLEHVPEGATVAVSCGTTVRALADQLPRRPQFQIQICQMSVESNPETIDESPVAVGSILKARCSSFSRFTGMQLPPPLLIRNKNLYRKYADALSQSSMIRQMRNAALGADFYFMGIGRAAPRDKEIGNGFHQLAQTACAGRLTSFVKRLGLVGEMNNRLFDKDGNDRTDQIPGLSHLVIPILRLGDLQSITGNVKIKRKVILLFAGQDKVDAAKVALRSKLANVVITTRNDAMALLDIPTPTLGKPVRMDRKLTEKGGK